MATYYLKVTVADTEIGVTTYDDVMKGKNMSIDPAKQLATIISQGGFLKEHKGVIATGDDTSFTFYPPHRVLEINIVPESILTTVE